LWLTAVGCLFLPGCGQKPASEAWSEQPRESARTEASRAPTTAERYDLSRDEERGGHTLRKHVGRTDDELRERLARERDISAASTWTDRAAAEETVAAALRAERGRIESWTRRGDRRPNLALHFDAGRVIGRSMVRGSDQSEPCTRAVIVLRGYGDGFYVLTTYPEAWE
jgi:toxin YxiD